MRRARTIRERFFTWTPTVAMRQRSGEHATISRVCQAGMDVEAKRSHVPDPSPLTKVPTTVTMQVILPPGATSTFAMNTHFESVLRDLAVNATTPGLIR